MPHPHNSDAADRGSRYRPSALGEMDGAKGAQEAGGGGGGATTRLATRRDACGGGAVIRVSGVDEGADTELEPSPQRGVGGVLGNRGGGDRLQARLESLLVIRG